MKSSKVCIKTKITPAFLSLKDQRTEHKTVKWFIRKVRFRSAADVPEPHARCRCYGQKRNLIRSWIQPFFGLKESI